MTSAWSQVPLYKILTPARVPVTVKDDDNYRQVRVAIKGQGLHCRRNALGSEIQTKRQFRIATNQLLVSKIDARNGGLGIVPQELDGAIVSNDFPAFDIDSKQCLPGYLELCVHRSEFWDECLLVSEGTTNRVRLVLKEFLELELDLPPLVDQKRIVAMVAKAHRVEAKWNTEATKAKRALAAARVELIEESDGDVVALDEVVLGIEGGKSPKCLDRPPLDGEYGVLKVSAIRDGRFRPGEAKALPADVPPWPKQVRAGDLLYSRANTAALVGAMCRCEADYPRLLLCDKTMRVTVDEGRIVPDFLVEAVGTPSARDQIEIMAGGTSDSMRNISQPAYLETEIVVPDPDRQLEIVRTLATLRAAVVRAEEMAEHVRQVRVSLVDELVTGAREMPRLAV